MSGEYSTAVSTARAYYDSDDADAFYRSIWGGEDIHIGIYHSPGESIPAASRRAVEHLASLPEQIDARCRVLDIGAGYGGAARYLAGTRGCRVVALNLSAVENERHRQLNGERGLDPLIEVVDGHFEQIPGEDGSFDLVWSQDALLHSGDRGRVVGEVARVLREGGDFVFTDPMQSDDCPEGVLEPILERIHLETLGSPGFYREAAREQGLEEVCFVEMTRQLTTHYTRVLEETEKEEGRLEGVLSDEYLERMKKGLRHWIAGGRQGHLCWGAFHFRKG